VGIVAILGCLYLFWSLPLATTIRFFIWNLIGLVVYLLYARHQSLLATES
jgi:APA family basic amino acid/polyamine antiporter